MDHDRIHRILELNNQLLKTNSELIRAIRERAKPEVINEIRETIKAIKGEISHIEVDGVDNLPSSS